MSRIASISEVLLIHQRTAFRLRSSFWLPSRSTHAYAQHPTRSDDCGKLLSRVAGPSNEPLSEATLGQFWKSQVNKYGDRPALVVRHESETQHGRKSIDERAVDERCIRWTFSQMDDHVSQLVRGLRQIGVRRGDRVAVLMMNNSAMASLQMATALVGAILVTLNPSYTSTQLLGALNHVTASYLFIVPSLRTSNYLDNLCTILPSLRGSASRGDATLVQDEACPSLRKIVLVDNVTARPGHKWRSESELGKQRGYSFDNALAQLNGRAIDYRDVLIERDLNSDVRADEEKNLSCRDIVNLQLTSGTTGSPKAVALSSYNLVNNGTMLGRIMRLTERDVLNNVPPLFHCFGLTLGNLAAWSAGACVVYPSEGFNALRALRTASEERVTAMHGVPAHFIAELDVLRRRKEARKSDSWPDEELASTRTETWDFSALRTGFTSGSTVPIELMRAIMDDDNLGAKEQTVVYGMTETSPVTFGCETDADVTLRCQTVGRVVPHVHAKICAPDDENGRALPVGEVGELCTAGYVVMDGGYWEDRVRTEEALQVHDDEPHITWMRTGDLAEMDEEGYVKIRGRVKDLIIRGGENLTATGIENCIDTLPGVASSAVVAVPDARMGETVGVFISRIGGCEDNITPAQVRDHVKKHLSGQSAPEWVWFLGQKQGDVPDQMPTTASGKVQKVILREWARELAAKDVGRAKSTTSSTM